MTEPTAEPSRSDDPARPDDGVTLEGPAPGHPLSDAELTRLALAARPDAPLGDDAVPLSVYLAAAPGPLPDWYMPPALARGGSRWRGPVVLAVIAAFLIIDAFGLCSTFGPLVFA